MGYRVSLISQEMLDERLPYLEVKNISGLLDPSDNLDLLAANGTSIPYKGWTEIDLNIDSHNETSPLQIRVPFFITTEHLDYPIGKEYKIISYDRLSCGSTNVIYGIHCVHCGLVYVGETGRSLRSRMNGHRSEIKKGGQSLLHRNFHQPDHSVDDMRVQILKKVYHNSENPTLLTSLRRTRELFWIKELGTAKPYGFNDQIKEVGTLSSISCKKTNIYSLFNKQPKWKRSHGKRHYNKRTPQPDATTSTLVDLVDMIEKPEGVHNINTKLFSVSFPQLRSLQKLALESTNFDYSSADYRVIAIILNIANYRLFRPVRSDVPAEKPKHFMKIKFLNKAVDAINLPALLRSTSVTDKIPVYFRDKEPPIVSYEYTSTVASKLFNFAPTLSNLNVS